MPKSAEELIQSALALGQKGHIEEALQVLEEAIGSHPSDLNVLLIAGILNARAGRFNEAIAHFERIVTADASSFSANYWLSVANSKLRQTDAATKYARRAVTLDPRDPLAQERLAYCLMEAGNHVEAETCFVTAVRLQPNNPTLLGGLGLALEGQGKVPQAIGLLQRATQIDPRSANSFLHLAKLLTEEQEPEPSILAARRALQLRPNSEEAIQALVSALLQGGAAEEARRLIACLSRSENPTAKLYAFLGWAWQSLGEDLEARQAFDRALEIDPYEPEACMEVVRRGRMREQDLPFVEGMQTALKADGIPPETQRSLHFALGKACEDLGRYEEAMAHFDEANRISRQLKFGNAAFDAVARRADDEGFASKFSREFMERHGEVGSPDETPILVLGMMRSGTTLVEQILSSHPDVGGAGEMLFWTKHRQSNPASLKPLAKEYCAQLRSRVGASRFIVDKMPSNYAVLPLIHLALPKARIIHIRRHPVDTCVSIWTTPNTARTDWAHDKENVVFAYQQYRFLMEAWRKVLPEGAMLEIDYEDLAADPEPVTRRLIEFLGLEWDDACLRHHEGSRSVTTPSAWQVRQPMYTRSIGRWQPYRPWLGAFGRLLSDVE